MSDFNAKRVAALKERYAKAGFVKKVWKTSDEWTVTLEEYAEYINPMYKDVKKAEVIEKEYTDKSGKTRTFLKVKFTFEGGTEIEWDLPYEEKDEDNESIFPDYEEGDELKLNTIKLCTQTCLKEFHEYAIGEIK